MDTAATEAEAKAREAFPTGIQIDCKYDAIDLDMIDTFAPSCQPFPLICMCMCFTIHTVSIGTSQESHQ